MDAKLLEYQSRAVDWHTASHEIERVALNSLSLEQVRMALNNIAWGFNERAKRLEQLAVERRQELSLEQESVELAPLKKRGKGCRVTH